MVFDGLVDGYVMLNDVVKWWLIHDKQLIVRQWWLAGG